jgi:hypothetical protein
MDDEETDDRRSWICVVLLHLTLDVGTVGINQGVGSHWAWAFLYTFDFGSHTWERRSRYSFWQERNRSIMIS